jgi:aryl-alcohol dehydrogenase-like predicted oxidoreductase
MILCSAFSPVGRAFGGPAPVKSAAPNRALENRSAAAWSGDQIDDSDESTIKDGDMEAINDGRWRTLGKSGINVSPVALGCWPIAGVTTIDVNDADSIATIAACFDLGINHLDTAHVYGRNGESENLIRRALGTRRDEMVIATKCGVHYEGDTMVTDGRPAQLRRECEESLRRLGTDRVELLYLHSPDNNVPIEESAAALRQLQAAGKTITVGASNCSLEQFQAFHAICPLAAVQLPYNMLQREIEQQTIPWCRANKISVTVYWPLMKGLLADKLPRDGKLDPRDKRRTYPIYHAEQWQKNQHFLASLREAAALSGHTVAQLVINWTIHQPDITAALCGAKRPWQITETAGAMGWALSNQQQALITAAIADRGVVAAKRAFS